jgi:xanthine permease
LAEEKIASVSPQGSITPLYDVDDVPPLKEAIPLGIQHVLAMFASNVSVPITVAMAVGLTVADRAYLAQCAMLVAGIATFFQARSIGPIGAKLPVVMGTSSGFLPVCLSIAQQYGMPVLIGASFVGGFLEMFLGSFLKTLRRFFPPVVTGTVVLTIGLSLLSIGVTNAAGGFGAEDFGSFSNLALAGIVFIITVVIHQAGKGFLGASSILIATIIGFLVAIPMGKVDFSPVAEAGWFSFPTPLSYGIAFEWPAILAMLFMYIVTTVETVGDISGITMGGAGREATDRELSGGVFADGFFSSFAAIFNALPNTSFSQNVGLISFSGVMSNYVVKIGAIFLILCGLFPKIGALIAIIPMPVFGGGLMIMFAFIATSGMTLIASGGLTKRNMLIVAASLSLGLGLSGVPNALQYFPEGVKLIFSGAGIVPACIVALILNIVLPADQKREAVS